MAPLDLQRLAVRIERLQQTNYRGWSAGDDLEFANRLPGGRDTRRALPDPRELREWAKTIGTDDEVRQTVARQWRLWVATAQHLESLVSRNHPQKRMMRDLMRGKLPRRYGGGAARVASRHLDQGDRFHVVKCTEK